MNYRFLVENVRRAGCADRVQAFNAGVSEDGRTLALSFDGSINANAYSTINGNKYNIDVRTVSVKALWSAEYLGIETVVPFMKIDCEGCEWEVLPLVDPARVLKLVCETHPIGPVVSNMTRAYVEKACELGRPFAREADAG